MSCYKYSLSCRTSDAARIGLRLAFCLVLPFPERSFARSRRPTVNYTVTEAGQQRGSLSRWEWGKSVLSLFRVGLPCFVVRARVSSVWRLFALIVLL